MKLEKGDVIVENEMYSYCCFGYSIGLCSCGKQDAVINDGPMPYKVIKKND